MKITYLKCDWSDHFIADFNTDGDITFKKCKIYRKYTAQIRTEAWTHNLCGQILDSILLHVDSVTYVHKVNVYNYVKAGSLHDWAEKKIVMDS